MEVLNCEQKFKKEINNADGGYMILVANDDADMRAYFREFLEGSGFEVVEAANVCGIIEKLCALSPDLILMDGMMPGVDGFEACEQLGEHASTSRIPVIMVNEVEDPDLIDWAFDVGAMDHITTPINGTLLKHKIRILVERSRAELAMQSAQEMLKHEILEKNRDLENFKVRIQEEWQECKRLRRLLASYKETLGQLTASSAGPSAALSSQTILGDEAASRKLRQLAALSEAERRALRSRKVTHEHQAA